MAAIGPAVLAVPGEVAFPIHRHRDDALPSSPSSHAGLSHDSPEDLTRRVRPQCH